MAAVNDILFQDWHERFRGWSLDGSLASAARHALEPGPDDQTLLSELASQWTERRFIRPAISNMDGSADTDQMIQLIWGSVKNRHPETALRARVALTNFETNADAYDPLIGATISTTVNFTGLNTAGNYGFKRTPGKLVPESFCYQRKP